MGFHKSTLAARGVTRNYLAMHVVLWITWRCLWRNVTLFQNVTTFSWRKFISERRTLDSVPVETCSYIVFDSDQRCVTSDLILCCVWSASWRRRMLKTVSTSVIYLSTNMVYKLTMSQASRQIQTRAAGIQLTANSWTGIGWALMQKSDPPRFSHYNYSQCQWPASRTRPRVEHLSDIAYNYRQM